MEIIFYKLILQTAMIIAGTTPVWAVVTPTSRNSISLGGSKSVANDVIQFDWGIKVNILHIFKQQKSLISTRNGAQGDTMVLNHWNPLNVRNHFGRGQG